MMAIDDRLAVEAARTPESERKDTVEFLGRAADGKREWLGHARIHQLYYRGTQDCVLDPSSFVPRPDPRIRMVLNVSAGVIDFVFADMMQQAMELEGRAFGAGETDRWAAEVATAILRDHEFRNQSERKLDRLAKRLLITGFEGVRVGFDPDVPAIVEMTPDEAAVFERMATEERMMNGDTRPFTPLREPQRIGENLLRITYPIGGTMEQNVSGNLVFSESTALGGAPDWSDVSEFIVVDYPSVRQARNRFPDVNPNVFQPMMIPNTKGAGPGYGTSGGRYGFSTNNNQIGDSFEESHQMCWLVHHWKKAGSTWDESIYTGPDCMYRVRESRGIPANPYVWFECLETESLWPKGYYEDMRRPQHAANVMASTALEYFSKQLKDVILLPHGADTSPITSDFNLVIRYDPNEGAPNIMPANYQTLDQLTRMRDDFLQMVLQLGKSSSVASGNANQRLAGKAIEELVQQWQTPNRQVRKNVMQGRQAVGRIVLLMAQEYYGIGRAARIMNRYSEAAVREFKGADLMTGTDVQVVEVDSTRRGREAREDRAIKMAQYGLLSPENEGLLNRIDGYVSSGILAAPKSQDVEDAELEALKEYRAIVEGRVDVATPQLVVDYIGDPNHPLLGMMRLVYVKGPDDDPDALMEPLFDPNQVHEIHFAQHQRQLRDPALTEPQRRLIRYHLLQETKVFMDFVAQQQQQAMLEERAQIAKADAAGTTTTSLASIYASADVDKDKPGGSKGSPGKNSPAGGGRESGRTRQRQAMSR